MALTYPTNTKSQAQGWFLHRITGTFLVFLLLTHFWIQHYDSTTQSVVEQVVAADAGDGIEAEGDELQPAPTYSADARAAVEARRAQDPAKWGPAGAPVTSYDVAMLRLADPVYAVLWKAFNLFFLVFALHHGFYGLNNVLTDYLRRPMHRAVARMLSWTVALVLLLVGSYSVVTAGWNMEPATPGQPATLETSAATP